MHHPKDNFLQSHSMRFLEMAFRGHRQERLQNADGRGKQASACGDSIEFFLVIQNAHIDTIAYALNGCMNTNACANAVIELIEGKSLEFAWALSPNEVFAFLESLPQDHFHCTELAIAALRTALSDYRDNQRDPWKKMYR